VTTGTTGTVPAPPVQAAVTTTTQPATQTVAPKPPAPAPASAPTQATATTRLERSPSGAATITNAAPSGRSGTAAPDATRAKYDALAQQMAADPVGAYTVQFELVCETASITKAMSAGRSSVWWAPISYRGRPCYRVFWGRFATREEAVKAAAEIPAALHGSAPVVVKIPR
jgi:septal ring-binding cell division protein DamX